MDEEQVTDLHVFGDWRPLHREAVLLASVRGIRVWAYEEGYLRPDYITMEQGGVNGLSSLPNTREGMAELAAHCPDVPEARKGGNPQTVKTWREPSFSGFLNPPSAERQPRGLGLVSARAEPFRPAEAFRSGPSGRVPRPCVVLSLSPPV